MASQFPSAPEQIIPTAPNVGPEPHHPLSSQASLQASFLGLHDMTNALNLSLPPNTLWVLAQGHASGRLPMPPNYHAGQPSGTAELDAAGIPTTMETHSQSTMLRPSPATTLGQPSRGKVRARRAPRKGKSKARDTVSRGPAHTTASWGDHIQRASLPNEPTGATQAEWSRGEATPPTTYEGSSGVSMPAMQPISWATATSKEIVSRLPELNGLPLKLLDAVLPNLRTFIEEHEGSVGNNSRAAGHGQDSPAETPEALRVAQPAGPSQQMAQADPSLIIKRSEPMFPMVQQSSGLDQPPATPPTCGGFKSLSQPRSDSENAEPQLIFEEPPSTALQGLLDIDQIWGMDLCQPESSLAQTLSAGEVIERSPWAGSDALNTSSGVGYDVDLGGVGMGALGQVDLSALLDGWEGFADM